MTLSLSDIAILQTKTGNDLLTLLQDEDLSDRNTLNLVTTLRKTYSADQVRAGLTMAKLRESAKEKFGEQARSMFFTQSALEQASDPLVRSYRAHIAEGERILDVCCGIGSDSFAFAEAGKQTVGIDIDPVRIAIAEHNADCLEYNSAFRVQDAYEVDSDGYDLIFFDPARRDSEGRRLYDVESYLPPLSLIDKWDAKRVMVKLSPGVDLAKISHYGGEVQFISVAGDLKEALLCPDRSDQRTTAVLIQDDRVHVWHKTEPEPDVALGEPRAWLCEPNAAILRAQLVRDVVQTYHGAMLDETIAYFTTDHPPDSEWVRSWRILAWIPFSLKKLRAALRARHIGTVTVKKRGSALDPQQLTQQLRLKGDNTCTVFLTRLQSRPIAIICENSM